MTNSHNPVPNIKQHVDDIEQRINNFIKKLIWFLIVANVILGGITVYDKFIYDHTPIVYREIATIHPNEV